MAEGTGSDSARRWRDKYLDLLDSHEKLKNSSELQHDQMRRGLVMVSLLAEGQAAHSQVSASFQRLQQESHAIRSSLLAQQQNSFNAGYNDDYDALQDLRQ